MPTKNLNVTSTQNQLDILLIANNEDDFSLFCDLVAEIAEGQFKLDWVDSYEAGLKAIECNRHDAYLVDYSLGQRTGMDLLREATNIGCKAPFILLSGQSDRDIGLETTKDGVADHLVKDQIDAPLLQRSIRYAIALQKAAKAQQETQRRLETRLADRTAGLSKANTLLTEEISKREQAEAALRMSEVQHRALFESMKKGVALYEIILDENDRPSDLIYVDGNATFEKHAGVKREDVIGKKVSEVFPGVQDIEPDLISICGTVGLTGESTQLEFYFEPLEKWLSIFAYCPEKGYCATVLEDITDRKKAEEALREARDELQRRVEERTTELVEANAQLREEIAERQRLELQVNESLRRRTRQIQTSTEIAQEVATTPKLDDLFRQVVNLVQKQFGYYHAHVYTVEGDDLVMQEGTGAAGESLKRAGHRIPLQAEKSLVAYAARSGKPVLVSDVYKEPSWLPNPLLPETKSEIAAPIMLRNEVLGVLDVQNDTVGSLSQEDQILLMGLCGQIAVAINNRRLETKRREAEAAQAKLIEDLDAFAHTVGYNLREPLALIIGYTELLKEQARLPEELQAYLNAIARNGHKMGNIIDEIQLLTGVRKADVEIKPLNMARIVAEVHQRLAYLIEEYGAKIMVSEYWPVALGHKPWVEEVWTNYLSNAIRYGGQPPLVQVGATAQSDGMVRFWVRDNGPGLDREEQVQLFTEFKHFGQINVKGYGLGLSIVRRIITKLGGDVGVESDGEPGKGSIFYFTLPEFRP